MTPHLLGEKKERNNFLKHPDRRNNRADLKAMIKYQVVTHIETDQFMNGVIPNFVHILTARESKHLR